MTDKEKIEELYTIPGSKKNDLIWDLYYIEKRMKENPGMTLEQSIEASGISMSRYKHAVHLRAVRKRTAKLWGNHMD